MKAISYTTQEQIRMFNQATSAVVLLETKEILQEIQLINATALIVFDINMNHYLTENLI